MIRFVGRRILMPIASRVNLYFYFYICNPVSSALEQEGIVSARFAACRKVRECHRGSYAFVRTIPVPPKQMTVPCSIDDDGAGLEIE